MGVCVDNNGRVIVADSGNKRVVLYSSEGVFIKELYKSDFDKTPMCVCAPSMDRVLVHLASPGKVQIRTLNYTAKKIKSQSCTTQ